MKATVVVRPKQGILDPQGAAVQGSLRHLGFAVDAARIGRVVDLDIEAANAADARAQVERMLKDPRAERFITDFTNQWLDLKDIDDTTPDKKLYPDYDKSLERSMVAETTAFFRETLERGLTLREFLKSDWTMANARLAKFYGLPEMNGVEMQRVALPADSHRGGLLTQASTLSLTSDGTRQRPVHRGNSFCRK